MTTPAPPQVSVVIGVRDGGDDLPPTLESVLGQRETEIEVIVVDDGSKDSTPALLAEYSKRNANLRVFRQPAKGLTEALIRGCELARAPLIARQDVGDLSHPVRMLRQKTTLDRHPEVVLVSCWTACFGPGGEHLFVERGSSPPDRTVPLLAGEPPRVAAGPTSHGSAMFRADAYRAVGGYRPEFAIGQDWDLWQRLGLAGRFSCVGASLYARVLGLDSLSFAFHDLQIEMGRISLAAVRARATGEGETEALARARSLSERVVRESFERGARSRSRGAYHVGEILRRRGDPRCRRYLADAARRAPWSLRTWLRLAQSSWLRTTPAAADLGAFVATSGPDDPRLPGSGA